MARMNRSSSKGSKRTVATYSKGGKTSYAVYDSSYEHSAESSRRYNKKDSAENRLLIIIFILIFGSGFISLLTRESRQAVSNVKYSERVYFNGDYVKQYSFNLRDDNYFVYNPIVNENYMDYYDYEVALQYDNGFGNYDYNTISVFNIWDSVVIPLDNSLHNNIRLVVLDNKSVNMVVDYSIQHEYVKPLIYDTDFEIKHDFNDIEQINSFGSYILTKNSFLYFLDSIEYLSNFTNIFLESVTTVLGYVGESLGVIMNGINKLVELVSNNKDNILKWLPNPIGPVFPIFKRW